MNELITEIFKNFIVDKIEVPVEFLRYTGTSDTFITWQSTGDNPSNSSDDEITDSIYELDVDIYSKRNYLNVMNAVKQKMKENNFVWTGDSPDMYEDDTKYYHKTISFEKENNVI